MRSAHHLLTAFRENENTEYYFPFPSRLLAPALKPFHTFFNSLTSCTHLPVPLTSRVIKSFLHQETGAALDCKVRPKTWRGDIALPFLRPPLLNFLASAARQQTRHPPEAPPALISS